MSRYELSLVQDFNPRSPRGGATIVLLCGVVKHLRFQSTLPTRGSDDFVDDLLVDGGISIHAPHEGERLRGFFNLLAADVISIHAPHEGERPKGPFQQGIFHLFQSTLPTRGSDAAEAFPVRRYASHFNPRSPRGGATVAAKRVSLSISGFQSTLPTRGSDVMAVPPASACIHFNPRSPRGGATAAFAQLRYTVNISIHAPHEGERQRRRGRAPSVLYFNPRSPRGGATNLWTSTASATLNFNPRSPRGGATCGL